MEGNGQVVELLRGIWGEMKSLGQNLGARIDRTNERLDRLRDEVHELRDSTNARLDTLNERVDVLSGDVRMLGRRFGLTSFR